MLTFSSDGSLLCVFGDHGASLIDMVNESSRELPGPPRARFVAFADQVWRVAELADATEVTRFSPVGLPFGEPLRTPRLCNATLRASTLGPPRLVACDESGAAIEVRQDCDRLVTRALGAGVELATPLSPGMTLMRLRRGGLQLMVGGEARAVDFAESLRDDRLLDAFALMGEGPTLLWLSGKLRDVLLVVDLRRGQVCQRTEVRPLVGLRVAGRRMHALVQHDAHAFSLVDLRFGRILSEWQEPSPVLDATVDSEGKWAVFENNSSGETRLKVVRYSALGALSARAVAEEAPVESVLKRALAAPPAAASPISPHAALAPPVRDRAELAAVELHALSPRRDGMVAEGETLLAGIEAGLDLVAAWCKRAIAAAWDSGRLSEPSPTDRPFAHEVAAVLDGTEGRAREELAIAEQRAEEAELIFHAQAQLDGSALSSLAAQFELSPLSTEILLIAAAPLLWGELARMYAIASNDEHRPLCDELLVGQILGPQRASRREIAAELSETAPLRRHGLVQVGPGNRPFQPLRVPEMVLSRLWGERFDEPTPLSGPVARRVADSTLAQLKISDALLETAVQALAQFGNGPARVVLRGREGSGRRTLASVLAAQAGRTLGVVDASLLFHEKRTPTELMRETLRDVALRGWIPCVTGLERFADDDLLAESLREVLRAHAGPLFFRAPAGVTPPLSPGYLTLDLPPLSEEDRAAVWRERLAAHQLAHEDADVLASKYSLGPGTIERICRQAAQSGDPSAPSLVESAVRQHRSSRIGRTATHVTRLASWSSLVLPGDLIDSLREFMARIEHRRTVYDRWGFDRLLTSARGLTALFQGGPGTGKSLVAGVIARELGYDLYRIDLGRVLSKWLGETEKNLGAVFDAAEEGEVVLLFDEADSLFAKRTDVKSSIDRYANVEINYLLQRLDSFEGIAILTTNFGTAIDNAFKRRLSLRLSFPFPDEEMREKLWRVHLPPELPVEGDFDFSGLAGRFKLSGGYIRNAALRAAFLAAREGLPVTQEHLERAVLLEYREVGKLSEDGILE